MKKLTYFNYALGPLGDREAIAAYTDCLFEPTSTLLLNGVMDKALTYMAEGPGFKSRLQQWNSFKNYKILFLIEDTSELEC